MTQPPNFPGDNQGGYPQNPQDPQQGGYQPGGFPPPQQPQPGYGQGGYPPPPAGGFPPPQGPGYGQGEQGFPPPQQPGYGQGGFPPPPAGGFPPPPGGFGAPQYGGGQQPFNIGDAFSWAWNKFTKNAAALIVPMLAYAVVLGLVGAIFGFVLSSTFTETTVTTTQYDYGSSAQVTAQPSAMTWVVMILGIGIIVFLAMLVQASYLSGLLDIADGKQVAIGSFFKPRNLGAAAVAAVLVALAVTIGYILCIVPGIAAAFLLVYATHFAVDRGLSGPDAVKASFETVKGNAGNSILTTLLSGLVGGLGTVLCYVGVLVTGPIAALVQVYAYRRLSGGEVAPLTP